ncbi:MAG: hypothetical protein OXC82_03380 [Rhodobacteraceae bacterium]|nr:hypothetical protein [Paracoccaceae bacterium]MCY4249464.1 hypothetical protein [Paracoccaceae bacterium]
MIEGWWLIGPVVTSYAKTNLEFGINLAIPENLTLPISPKPDLFQTAFLRKGGNLEEFDNRMAEANRVLEEFNRSVEARRRKYKRME